MVQIALGMNPQITSAAFQWAPAYQQWWRISWVCEILAVWCSCTKYYVGFITPYLLTCNTIQLCVSYCAWINTCGRRRSEHVLLLPPKWSCATEAIYVLTLSGFLAVLELTLTSECTEPALCSHLMISLGSAESQTVSVHPTYQNRVTALRPGDSYWTIIVSEIPSRCLNKPSNRAIILKQKVTSGVTTGPEINKAPNYDRSTGPIFGLHSPAVQGKIRFHGNLIPSAHL